MGKLKKRKTAKQKKLSASQEKLAGLAARPVFVFSGPVILARGETTGLKLVSPLRR